MPMRRSELQLFQPPWQDAQETPTMIRSADGGLPRCRASISMHHALPEIGSERACTRDGLSPLEGEFAKM
eukprot:5890705-Alexandrium_andersonii.AAC.1